MNTSPLLRLVLLALCLLPAACNSGPKERDPEELFTLYRESGFFYWQSEDFERAEIQFARALEIKPDDLSSNLFMANLNLLKGRTETLLSAEQRFLSIEDQTDYRVQLGLGQAREGLGVLYSDAAAEIAAGTRKTQAPDPAARVDELYEMSAETWSKAKQNYRATLEVKPNHADAINGMQRILALEGDLEGALVWTNRLLDLVKVDRAYYESRLARPGITDAEESDLRQRMQNSNDLAMETYLFGASLLHQLDRPVAELEYLQSAIDIAPERATLYSRRAQAQMALSNYEEAIHSLDRFLALSDLPFESADIQRAYELRENCERAVQDRELEERLKNLEAGL